MLPSKIDNLKEINFELGKADYPYIKNTNSQLTSCSYNKQQKEMSFNLKAFPRHKNQTDIISPRKPVGIFINGEKTNDYYAGKKEAAYIITIHSLQHKETDNFKVEF